MGGLFRVASCVMRMADSVTEHPRDSARKVGTESCLAGHRSPLSLRSLLRQDVVSLLTTDIKKGTLSVHQCGTTLTLNSPTLT